ncbi:MAG TPA: hypothetical protein VK154_16470 [Chitinophagales bacterium]|nr:hypothetical protein [Chitinophagales bacterium]
MSTYHPSLTLREALNIFFAKHNLGEEGGLNNNVAYLDMKYFRIPFPNTESRKRALVFHDIHHIVTGYESDWQGEAEIGAWEVSTGCGDFTAALVLDLGGIAVGLIFFPRKTFRAFIRGRRTQNLYRNHYKKEDLMKMSIAQIQDLLQLNKADNSPAKAKEVLAFIGWSLVSALWYLPFLVLCAAIGFGAYRLVG